jgi:two-component system chemotaxis response regulator CheY
MADFEFTEDLLTGIDDVDTQRHMLLELASDIVETADEERGEAFFERTSSLLKEYLAYHFASEEMAMREYHYPRLEAHRQHHVRIGVEFESLLLRVHAKGFTQELNAKYCLFVEDPMVQHIRTFDREAATFFRARNVQVLAPLARTAPVSGFRPGFAPPHVNDILAQLTRTGRTSSSEDHPRQANPRPITSSQCVPTTRMRMLIVDDDMTSRLVLRKMLEPFGRCDVAVNGNEAVEAFGEAHVSGEPYTLVCLDIMMPEMDGQAALKAIRSREKAKALSPGQAAKIVMTSALHDLDNVDDAYRARCDGYLGKPIIRDQLVGLLLELDLLMVREDG